ncbi:hypothetical protein ABZ371_20530 [Streptomyces sp. NPDC005899]|uniref:hypothetical protein n=1 Tax=Streptomyces sp. NPDC005899 TaxID=3155716 RepID=UPI0033F0B47E
MVFGRRTAAVSLSAAALMMAGAGAAQAYEEPKFQNNTQILSCLSVEVLDIPIASTANNNIDCSTNYESRSNETHVSGSGVDAE